VPKRRAANLTAAPIRSVREEGSTFEEIIGPKIRIDASGCWLWTGRVVGAGYGQEQVRGQCISVHRFVFETLVGPIPDGHHVHHTCEVRLCCNPDHLEALSPADHRARHN